MILFVTYRDGTREPMDLFLACPMPMSAGCDAPDDSRQGLGAYKTTEQKAEAAAPLSAGWDRASAQSGLHRADRLYAE